MRPAARIDRRRRQSGQLMPIAAVALVVLCAIAGLAIDSSRDYLAKRTEQNAADFAALAAAKQLTTLSQIGGPPASGAAPIIAAHDWTASNGYPTTYSTACDVATASSFTTSWFDVAGLPCGATSGFTNKVSVHAPPVALPGASIPPSCTGSQAYSCIQVVISAPVTQYFVSVLGVTSVYVTVSATAQAVPGTAGINAPPPNALTLYEKQSGCDAAGEQCFDESKAPARSGLSCSGGTGNCPTFWVNPNAGIDVYGVDGAKLQAGTDVTALQSNGDMVVQSRSTICDPFNARTCAHNTVVGVDGWATASGSRTYCSTIGSGGTGSCATTGPTGLQELDGSQTTYSSPVSWSPTVDTSKLRSCGALVLNGDPVSGPCLNSQEPYLIEPGVYSSIVINHGTYEFDQGLYDITGTAPVNTTTGPGYVANGIDHSNERAADFDLCTGGTATSCPNLTAGVWIGHGGGYFGTYVSPSGSCVGSTANSGGGGDSTVVSGSGVVFRLEPGSGGFVSTGEVSGLTLSGAGVGTLASVAGSPLLIDEENSSFIHLDAARGSWSSWSGSSGAANTVQGILYQTAAATAGGVEIDPGLASNPNSALVGQVLAYSFTTFGSSGAMDFRNGYGTSVVPGIATSGRNETSIISSVALSPAGGLANYSTLTVYYVDEWAMDAFVAYVKVNNGTPIFFSQGIWTTTPSPGSPQPPPSNNPGDQFPAYPSAANAGSYTVNSMSPPDWTYTIPNSNNSTIEAVGAWTWGHHKDIAGAVSGNYTAQLKYTFPNPNGSYVAITVFVEDGDRCGDYALASYTFKNTGLPFGGTQSGGSVTLVQ